jgi:hypothetical protein
VGGAQNFLGLVDAAVPAQPLAVLEAELCSFKRPLVADRVAEHVVGVGVRGRGVGEDAVGSSEQLAQPGRWPGADARVQFGDLLDDLASLRDAVGAGRGEREVPGRQVGHVRVVGSPVDPEQLPQLLEGGEVIAVRERAQAECVPGPRGDHPALLRVGAEGGQDEPVSMAGIPAGSLDRRDDKDAGRRGDVASRFVPGRGDQLKRVVPAPGVEVGPAERRQ